VLQKLIEYLLDFRLRLVIIIYFDSFDLTNRLFVFVLILLLASNNIITIKPK